MKIKLLAFCSIFFLLVSIQGCKSQFEYIAFTHCKIIDGTGDNMKSNQTIIIKGSIIYDLGPDLKIPKKCKVINASGKTFIPGLIDMHGHLYAVGSSQLSVYPKLYLAGGVTTIFSPGEFEPDKVIQLREKINKHESIGPTIFTAGSYFDTYPSAIYWIEACRDTIEVINKFEKWKDKIDAVKVYSNISEEQFKVIKRLAKRSGLSITGHLGSLELKTAIAHGINGFEHGLLGVPELSSEKDPVNHIKKIAELDLSNDSVQSLIKSIVQNNVYCDPTVVTFESLLPSFSIVKDIESFLTPEIFKRIRSSYFRDDTLLLYLNESLNKQLAFCKLLFDNGGILVTGTDPVDPKVLPGYGIKREMELFHKAGIPPIEVIKIATLNGASSLKIADRVGSIEKGKIADLVLLNGDPIENFKSIWNVKMVIKNGQIYDPGDIKKSIEHPITSGNYKN